MPNKKNKTKKRGTRRSKGGYDIAGSVSATRGAANALLDAKSSLPLLGNQYENKRMLYYDMRFGNTGTAGVVQVYYFTANGVYDPDVSGTGHQPVGFDQAMLFYEQYVVFRSKITVTFVSATAGAFIRCGVFLNPDTSNPTIGQIMENGYMKSTFVGGASASGAGPGHHLMKQVSLACDSVAYFNSKTKNLHMMRDVFTGTSAANPSEQVYFGIFSFNAGGANDYTVAYDVELSYDVRFWEPRKVSQSIFHDAMRKTLVKEEKEEAPEILADKPILVKFVK